jgi:hypothetical protein
MSDKVMYFAPCFMINTQSTSASDNFKTIIDYVEVNEYIMKINDLQLNIGGGFNLASEMQNYVDNDYVDNGYMSFQN